MCISTAENKDAAHGKSNLLHDCCNMVFQDIERLVELSDVEYVDIVVFACRSNVECLHGVPAQRVGCKVQNGLCQGRVCPQVVKHNASVAGAGSQHARFNLVECDFVNRVNRVWPCQNFGGSTLALEIENLEEYVSILRLQERTLVPYANVQSRGRCNGVPRPVMRQARESCVSEESVQGSRVAWCSWIPQLDRLVTRASEQLLIPSPSHSLDNVLVGCVLPCFRLAGQIPHLDDTVSSISFSVLLLA